ncbi:UNVERIFIED_CONTAM: hypothetical protein Sradi_6540900 [Sesamum radiatum]|uniref:Uncharacterized protein n=1 Tax=Sesamum radiatum TaxID=300843 RepID=A0AAW2JZ19_SESRA
MSSFQVVSEPGSMWGYGYIYKHDYQCTACRQCNACAGVSLRAAWHHAVRAQQTVRTGKSCRTQRRAAGSMVLCATAMANADGWAILDVSSRE